GGRKRRQHNGRCRHQVILLIVSCGQGSGIGYNLLEMKEQWRKEIVSYARQLFAEPSLAGVPLPGLLRPLDRLCGAGLLDRPPATQHAGRRGVLESQPLGLACSRQFWLRVPQSTLVGGRALHGKLPAPWSRARSPLVPRRPPIAGPGCTFGSG